MADNMHPNNSATTGVIITLDHIYQQTQATDKKVDKLITQFEERSDHESRIRALERKLWVAAGASGTLGAIGGALILAAVKSWL